MRFIVAAGLALSLVAFTFLMQSSPAFAAPDAQRHAAHGRHGHGAGFRGPVVVAAPVVPFSVPFSVPFAVPVSMPVAVPISVAVPVPVSVPVAVPISVAVPAPVPVPVSVPVAAPVPVSAPYTAPCGCSYQQ
jgi:hypothetical protein